MQARGPGGLDVLFNPSLNTGKEVVYQSHLQY